MTQLNPQEFKRLRAELGRTQAGMAKIVGTTGTTWYRWERGISFPQPVFQKELRKLQAYVARREEGE